MKRYCSILIALLITSSVFGQGRLQLAPPVILPAATSTTLGGVKIGPGLTITADGTLGWTNGYTLPAASVSTLGGIKIGSGLSVAGDGTVSAVSGGVTYAGRALIVYDGNSIPAGYGTSHQITSVDDFSAGPFPARSETVLTSQFSSATLVAKNFGVGGEQTPTMANNASQVDNLFNPTTYDRQIVIPFEMGNHICDGGATVQQAEDAYVAYCKARRTKGFLVVACTITARPGNNCSSMSGTEFENRRNQVNAWMRLHYLEFADQLADFDTQTITYNGDTHPDNAGAITMGNYIATKVSPLLVTGFNPQSIPFLLSGSTSTAGGSTSTASGNTVLLVSGNGANNSTTFSDASGNNHTVTAVGAAKVSTAQQKYGSGSIYLDGSSTTKVSVASAADLNLGTGDFTIEGFIYPISPAATPYRTLLTKRQQGSTYEGFLVILFEDNTLHTFVSTSQSPTSWDLINGNSPGTVSYNTWNHWAVSRQGSNWYFFLNGTLGSTATASGPVSSSTFPLLIGGDSDGENVNAYQHIRISKTCLYTTSFTPPTSF